jgi:hypothetical protein
METTPRVIAPNVLRLVIVKSPSSESFPPAASGAQDRQEPTSYLNGTCNLTYAK